MNYQETCSKIRFAIKNTRLLKTKVKKGIYAPGSVTQVLAADPVLLRDYEQVIHYGYTGSALAEWRKRFELIKTGYGLSVITMPVVDEEIDSLDNITSYMKQLGWGKE